MRLRIRGSNNLERRSLALQHLWYGVLILDSCARILDWNPAAERLLRMDPEQIPGSLPSEWCLETNGMALEQAILDGVERDGFWAGEVRCPRAPGFETILGMNVEPIRELEGTASGLVAVFRDIAERTQMEAELRAARAAAEAASEAKSQFLANISHEIRTPLNGILGITELSLDTMGDPEQREPLELIQQSAETLLQTVNEILDFSRIEAGRLELESVPVDLPDVIRRVTGLFRARAEKRGLELTTTIAPDVPHWLLGDPVRLQQVLNNLVGNAVKFTEAGSIELGVERDRTARRNRPGWAAIRFWVRDTGIGIPESKQEAIFHAFIQADGTTTRRYGGTGLGLAIVAALVRQMGGRVRVDSRPGEGSYFSFTGVFQETEAPAGVPPRRAEPAPRPIAAPGRSLQVLIAEDNELNQRVISRMVERAGHTVRLAATGTEALIALRDAPADVLLLDLQMPEMDGYEVTARIRAEERETGSRLPIYALTAHAMPGDAERSLAAGMDGHFPKPIPRDELLACLAEIARSAPEAIQTPAAGKRLDYDGLLAQYEDDPELLGDVVELYRSQRPRLLGRMVTALGEGSLEELARTAHTLKGSLSNLYAPRAREAAQQVEHAGRRGEAEVARRALDHLGLALEELEPELDQVLEEARHWAA